MVNCEYASNVENTDNVEQAEMKNKDDLLSEAHLKGLFGQLFLRICLKTGKYAWKETSYKFTHQTNVISHGCQLTMHQVYCCAMCDTTLRHSI